MLHPETIRFPVFTQLLRQLEFDQAPGLRAQLSMAPTDRISDIQSLGTGRSARPSSVLILFFPDKDQQTRLLMMKRPEYNGAHSGQICFPGGRIEKEDLNDWQAALREAAEEAGIKTSEVQQVGKLSDLYIPPSNYLVHPWIGIMAKAPELRPDPIEVAALYSWPLAVFLRQDARQIRIIRLASGQLLETPCFEVQGQLVWGATAMILAELLEMISAVLPEAEKHLP